jgi:predicted DNA binding CopG/RHH family protein
MQQKKETKNNRITIRLNDRLMESIKNRSESQNKDTSQVIRHILENELFNS